MLQAIWNKNDKQAKWLIAIFSIVVFGAVTVLGKVKLDVNPGFDVHIFASLNAGLNTVIALLLIAALVAVKNRKYHTHKNLMLLSLGLSVLFLISYIAHHLLAGEARFGDLNHDGIVSADEKTLAGNLRYIYYFILATHIILATLILPFILFTAYRALTGEWILHKKLARYTWPLWLYVAITGPVVYWMIKPYYN